MTFHGIPSCFFIGFNQRTRKGFVTRDNDSACELEPEPDDWICNLIYYLYEKCREYINCPDLQHMIRSVLLEQEGGGLMRRTEILQEVGKMRVEEAYRGWHNGRFKVRANLLKSVAHEQEPDARNQ